MIFSNHYFEIEGLDTVLVGLFDLLAVDGDYFGERLRVLAGEKAGCYLGNLTVEAVVGDLRAGVEMVSTFLIVNMLVLFETEEGL